MLIAEEYLLLSLDDESGKPRIGIQMLSHQLVQRGDPGQTLRQPTPGPQPARPSSISMS